ncbi:hypothetical protein TNCV_787851 [Trichonephila clavipes]|nr:hypothetical protein TNCV_787851 [Trichonephila clavipes]
MNPSDLNADTMNLNSLQEFQQLNDGSQTSKSLETSSTGLVSSCKEKDKEMNGGEKKRIGFLDDFFRFDFTVVCKTDKTN